MRITNERLKRLARRTAELRSAQREHGMICEGWHKIDPEKQCKVCGAQPSMTCRRKRIIATDHEVGLMIDEILEFRAESWGDEK